MITAIIPAYNEEKTITSVIAVLRATRSIDTIIVVDDGSTDKTAEVAADSGVQVLRQPHSGKGAALAAGAHATDAGILFFSDADLIGLSPTHVETILLPVIEGTVAMSVGLRDRGDVLNWLMRHIFPIIGGERAIRRNVFLGVSALGIKDFGIEIAMNVYCKKNHLPIHIFTMQGVQQVIKERKYGILPGLISRLFMIVQVARAEFHFRYFFKNGTK
ncbi:glycosyltransferase [Candidatus Uhrbacteria bacterium]|nr:glycosyltransferase [Candidatus Uhrbacteria bacterium]